MITFEINKWVLFAIICGIMLLGALIEVLIACVYSNAKKARTDESADKITQLEDESKLYSDAIKWLRFTEKHDDVAELERRLDSVERGRYSDNGRIDILQQNHNSLAKKYEDVLKNQIVTEKRINQLTSTFHRFETDTSDDFHDLEEHVHHWLNSKPHRKDKDPAIEFNYNLDCCVPTRNEAMRIIDNLYKKFNYHGYITIADYRQEFGRDCTLIQENYGWNEFDLSAVYAHYVNGEYKVHMPEPILLFDD